MRRFLFRRFVFALFSLWGITIVVFILSRLGPDPLLVYVREGGYGMSPETIAALRDKWALDEPPVVQYFIWLGNVLQGDFGDSIATQRPVLDVIAERVGATVQLGIAAWIVGSGVGIPLGIIAAVRRASVWDYIARFIALIGQATPSFWLAIVLILVFSIQLDLLPTSGRAVGEPLTTRLKHMVLPVLALGFEPWAAYLRLTRSSMLEVLDAEYIKLARAKGTSRMSVIWKHAFRNALIQPLTISAVVLASFMTGTVFIETVFAWPGLGRLAVTATLDNDFPVVSAVVLIFGVAYVFLNFMADMAYAVVDPRIRYS